MKLTTTNHSRNSANLTYLYPVLSRRAGGVSIGVNLNPNNACNWRCMYCQVPGLIRGRAPVIDLDLLRSELGRLLGSVVSGDFFDRFEVPETLRRVSDIAISGNGEPTSAAAFPDVVDVIGEAAAASGLLGGTHLVLITNGSLTRRKNVQSGLARWSRLGGEVWFKLDSATREGLSAINGICRSPAGVARDLAACAATCPTWIQTCLFALDEHVPSSEEQRAYLDFLGERLRDGVSLRGVLLYGLARPSLQPGADRLSRLPEEWMEEFAARTRELGLTVRVHL